MIRFTDRPVPRSDAEQGPSDRILKTACEMHLPEDLARSRGDALYTRHYIFTRILKTNSPGMRAVRQHARRGSRSHYSHYPYVVDTDIQQLTNNSCDRNRNRVQPYDGYARI